MPDRTGGAGIDAIPAPVVVSRLRAPASCALSR